MYAPFVGTIGCCHKLGTFGVLHKLQVCEHLIIPVCMFCASTYSFADCLLVYMDGNTMVFDIEGTNVSVSIAYRVLWLQRCRTKLRRSCIVLLHGLVPGTFPGTSALWR